MSQGFKKQKVYIGLSGGVDSSVSTKLLIDEGYDVIGVFIKVWQPDWISCTAKEDRLDAMRICASLGIKFLDIDLEKEYKSRVIDYMIEEYKKGRTPNPDVMCNTFVKFGAFFDWAMKNGADFVATGHYAQIKKDRSGEFGLYAGEDEEKDQSYFLWGIIRRNLSKIKFPIGALKKPEVRKLAKKFNLITADKKDSQGLCFIGKIDVKDFLSKYIKSKGGKVLDIKGKEIGTHNGAVFFTIGERHGFEVKKVSVDSKPLYVVSKNIVKNTITVSEFKPLTKKNGHVVKLEGVNELSEIENKEQLFARFRYRAKLTPVVIEKEAKNMALKVKREVDSLTSGQSVVLYNRQNKCVGGAIVA